MYVTPPQAKELSIPLTNNPTDTQRHDILYNYLAANGRTDDYDNILSLMSPPRDITQYASLGEFKNIKVGIIGGGITGLSAAFELRKLGYDITIFEPTTGRIGGRIYTYYFDSDKKLYAELGAMRIPVSHEATWHYINLFKLDTEPFIIMDPNTFTYVRGVRARNDLRGENIFHEIYPKFALNIQEKNTPWPELYKNVNRYYLAILPPDIRKQILMTLPRYDYRQEKLSGYSLHDALERYGLSPGAVDMVTNIIPLLSVLDYHSYETVLSEEYSLDYLGMYRIPGGMVNLPMAFYNSLISPNPSEYPGIPQGSLGKVNLRMGFAVMGIYKSGTDSKVTLSYLNVSEPSREYHENFDYVICTLPFTTLRLIQIQPDFSSAKMQAIRSVIYDDAFKVLLLCRERFWENQGIFGGSSSTDSVIQTILYPQDQAYCMQNTASCPESRPGILEVYNIGQDAVRLGNVIPSIQYFRIAREVEKVHGLKRGYLDSLVTDVKTIDWAGEPWFHGAFQSFLPGQMKAFRYVATTPEYDNRVFFAGDYAASKNVWIQGALQSSMRTVNDVAYYSVIHKYQK